MLGFEPEQLSRFYANRVAQPPRALSDWPFTTKADLVADQQAHPPYGRTLTQPLSAYTRLHQTSGTSTGQPLRWLDTPRNWDWMLGCWQQHFAKLGLTHADRLYFPFSFGPFLGFWTAFEYASRNGYFLLPGGGLNSSARLKMILEHGITVVFATPTYAWHLAEVAEQDGIDLPGSAVRAIVVAGEPGGAIPEVRQRLERRWGARVFDHYGLTEVGPIATERHDNPLSLEVLDSEYLVETIEPGGTRPVPDGEVGELVVTNLGRIDSPLIRYRTGDLVRLRRSERGTELVGGVLGRCDDMLHIRGNNVYPSAIEAIVRRFPDIVEYRLIVDRTGPLAELTIELETSAEAKLPTLMHGLQQAIRQELLFRVELQPVPPGTLPRFEMKARRVITRQK